MTNEERVSELANKMITDQAFPSVLPVDSLAVVPGLSKREYFAGLIMQSLLSSEKDRSIQYYAQIAVQSADILIAELQKPKS